MARIDPIDEDSPGVDAESMDAVKARRGGRLLNLDRQLLHSPPLARGWNHYMGAVRAETILDGALRELVILLVALLNRAPYEFAQHAPVARHEPRSCVIRPMPRRVGQCALERAEVPAVEGAERDHGSVGSWDRALFP